MEHKTGLEDYYVIRGQKKMRFGYTTGSCAAAACKGACLMLLGKEKLTSVPLMTPKGILLDLELHDIQISENQVTCAVRKDAGDDPDTTNGILVYATVWKTDTAGIVIDGGVGVGRVTRPGLSQKVGEAEISSWRREESRPLPYSLSLDSLQKMIHTWKSLYLLLMKARKHLLQ